MFDNLDKRSRLLFWTAGIILIISIAVSEYLLGFGVSISIFYLVPISLAAWYLGKGAASFFAFLSGALWFVVDETSKNPFAHTYVPYWNTAVRLFLFLVVVLLLDGFKREKTSARVDYMTGLGNRRNFFERAEAELERSRRYGHAFTFAYIDVDHFKSINDQYGHAEGDALLRSIADTMKRNVRTTDVAARLGGDEFGVLLPESGREAAESFFMKLHRRLSDAVRQKAWPVSFSIGVVTFEKVPSSIDEMIKIADQVLYAIKEGGKNFVRLEVYSKDSEPCFVSDTSPSFRC